MFLKVKLFLARLAANFSSLPRRFKQVAGTLLAIVLIVVAVFIGRTIHHHSIEEPKRPSAPVATKVKQTPAKPTKNQKSGGQIATNKQSSGSSAKKSSGSSATGTTPGSTNGSATIPNTGPGSVAAIFAGATAAGALAHFGISRRQNS